MSMPKQIIQRRIRSITTAISMTRQVHRPVMVLLLRLAVLGSGRSIASMSAVGMSIAVSTVRRLVMGVAVLLLRMRSPGIGGVARISAATATACRPVAVPVLLLLLLLLLLLAGGGVACRLARVRIALLPLLGLLRLRLLAVRIGRCRASGLDRCWWLRSHVEPLQILGLLLLGRVIGRVGGRSSSSLAAVVVR